VFSGLVLPQQEDEEAFFHLMPTGKLVDLFGDE
jgi:hypothetical protein